MSRDKVQLRRYFLGDLSDEETESFDIWVISNEDSHDELEAAEDELIEDYLEGNLSERDRALFLENFLVSNERREGLELTALLRRESGTATAETLDVGSQRSSFLDRLMGAYRPLAAAAAVVIIGFVSFVAWQVFFSKRPTALEQEYALLNQAELAVDDPAKRSVVPLAPGQLRDSDKPVEIAAESLSDAVLFRLFLSYRAEPGATFKLDIVRADEVTFTQDQVRSYSTNTGSEVRVLLPRSMLAKGTVEIRISDTNNAERTLTYGFLVR